MRDIIPDDDGEKLLDYICGAIFGLAIIILCLLAFHGCAESVQGEREYQWRSMNGEARYRANEAIRREKP